ncbi:MAG: methanogenesis marker 8 protein [bacterium]
MHIDEICNKLHIRKEEYTDLHIIRGFSSFAAISNKKIIAMTDPWMKYCPLFTMLYNRIEKEDIAAIKNRIREALEEKIEKFGSYTSRRELKREDIAVPYGASEIMMYALRKRGIDAAVVVCDGAGTVICDEPSLVQGIGARMNGLFYTTPIQDVIKGIEKQNGIVVFPDNGTIDQISGLKKAAEKGYTRIAVTINGFSDDDLTSIPEIEREYGITVFILIVCTTGITEDRADQIAHYADLIWSCASGTVRERIGRISVLQISRGIPVFVLTRKGLDFVSYYASDPARIRDLDLAKQYIIAGKIEGIPITMGTMSPCIAESVLPVRSPIEPK